MVSRRRRYALAAMVLVAISMAVAVLTVRVTRDPSIPLLLAEGGAEWICVDAPPLFRLRREEETTVGFRVRFSVRRQPEHALFCLRAMKSATIMVDDRVMGVTTNDLTQWKRTYCVDLASALTPGEHDVTLLVLNRNGPACVLAYCPALDLYTGGGWETTLDGRSWAPARLASDPRPADASREFPRVSDAIRAQSALLCAVFLITLVVTVAASALRPRFRANPLPSWVTSPETVRWGMLLAFAALGINNLARLPVSVGFDCGSHIEYVRYVAQFWRIPLANEGWQMFQSPLFYVLSAPIYLASQAFLPAFDTGKTLRVLPLLCGIANIEIAFRMLRCMLPADRRAQIAGVVFVGVLPVNLYMFQFVSNEPLYACLSSLVLLECTRLLHNPLTATWRRWAILGVLLGLAFLAKATAVLLVPLVAAALLAVFYRDACRGTTQTSPAVPRSVHAVKSLGLLLTVAGAVAGWYYVRNCIALGRPFVGGWDSTRGMVWWQDPGYRTPYDFFRFGEALVYPIYAGVISFWDGLYSTLWLDGLLSGTFRPPWNYDFLLSCAWLALLPTFAILLGIAAIMLRPQESLRTGALFSVLCVAVYFAALVGHYLTTPFWCATKAFYALGAMPCLVLLFARGIQPLTRRPWMRAPVYALLACWAVSSYAGYFVTQ